MTFSVFSLLSFYLSSMKKLWIFLPVCLLLACEQTPQIIENEAFGEAQGTTYSVKFISSEEQNLKASFDSIFRAFDASMSTYKTNSLITAVNAGDTAIIVDDMFLSVLERSLQLSKETQGQFDVTVGPLVEVWGFGKKIHLQIDTLKVDSARQYVGYQKIEEKEGEVKIPAGARIDFNGIAQGYTVDVIARFLEAKGISRYMVEVGGEVMAKGLNKMDEPWKIGVDKPSEEIDQNDRFQVIVALKDKALATSGNYRKFWVDQATGIKYAHTIDPLSGFPARNQLLSVTIIANNCMDADGYATACMVMGTEKALRFVEAKPDLEAYLIYSDENGDWQVAQTSGFANYVLK